MKPTTLSCLFVHLMQSLIICGSCNKPPSKIDYLTIDGYVIGKETCNADEFQDYWLLDFTLNPNTPQVGDSIELNSVTFTNVLKVRGLDDRLKYIGMKVGFDYRVISPNKEETGGCSVSSPTTYKLKELFILNQFEIR